MKISELMERLGELQGAYGDIEVLMFDEYKYLICQISSVQPGFNVFSKDDGERAALINSR